jgi:hypothetical protein
MAMDELRFEIPKHDYSNRDIVAKQEARRLCPEGYFGSKVYFATVDGKVYANTTIRKWD